MKNRVWILCCIVSFACCSLLFAASIFFAEMPEIALERWRGFFRKRSRALEGTRKKCCCTAASPLPSIWQLGKNGFESLAALLPLR